MRSAAALALTLLAATAAPRAVPANPLGEIAREADWILSTASPDGAIALTPERDVVVPYTASLAAAGLARAHAATRDPRYATAAWRWLDWYARHQSPWTGYVTDHVRDPDGSWVSNGHIDATDSYAATFLIALNETFQATGDVAHLRALADAMRLSLIAIEGTKDPEDGLYWALPGFDWKYTMDLAEVYAGLIATVNTADAAGKPQYAAEAAAAAASLAAAADRLWDPARGAYDWGKHRSDPSAGRTEWHRFYPSSSAQAWSVVFGLARPDRTPLLMHAFDRQHPDWDRPLAVKGNDLGEATAIGYWPLVGIAYARTGNPLRAAEGARTLTEQADAAGRVYPFTSGTAAGLILLRTEPAVSAVSAVSAA